MPLNVVFKEYLVYIKLVTLLNSDMLLRCFACPVEDINDGGCDMPEPAEHSEIHTEQVELLIRFTF